MKTPLPTLLLTLALALPGCGAFSTPAPEGSHIAPPGRVVVAPLNLSVRAPAELSADTDPVWQALVGYLRGQDRQVAVLDPIDAERLWLETIADLERSGETANLPSTSSEFARRVREQVSYDLLVLPSVVLRRARMRGHEAAWDGVRQQLALPILAHIRQEVDVGAFTTRVNGYRGSLSAASLHVALLWPDGAMAYQGIGGLGLVQEVGGFDTAGRSHWTLEPRADPFGDTGQMLRGVEHAFEARLEQTARAW